MDQLKAILIDDEPRGISSMQKLLQINCPDVNVAGSCTDADEAINMIRGNQPDLIFLDIAMPLKNGFDLLRELNGFSFEVIFVTAHNQFMIEAFHSALLIIY